VRRQPEEERSRITDLGSAYLPTAGGRAVPLTRLAKVRFDWELGVMWREGRDFAVTVQGSVVEGVQGPTVTTELRPALQQLQSFSRALLVFLPGPLGTAGGPAANG
jgi:multidrug efflux pump subunit AcrB